MSKADSNGLVTEDKSGGLVTKAGCIVVKTVRGFGPYAYRVIKQNQKQKWEYLGRADKLMIDKRVGNSGE